MRMPGGRVFYTLSVSRELGHLSRDTGAISSALLSCFLREWKGIIINEETDGGFKEGRLANRRPKLKGRPSVDYITRLAYSSVYSSR
jgi:hypothetical protein